MSNIIYFAFPLFLVTMIGEFMLIKKRFNEVKGYEQKDSITSLSMGIGNVLISLLPKPLILALNFWLYNQFGWFADFLQTQLILMWVLLFFAEDLGYYWFHRVSHEMRWAWAAHVNHHSSQFYNLSTALRQSWTTPFYNWMFFIPLPMLGFHPLAIVTMHAFSLLYQYWIHTETIGHMGWFEKVFNTPSHHRVHHGSNPQYLDKNYGGFMIIYDRLFGTFEPEKEAVKYGLVHNISTHNPIKVAFHEWQAMFSDIAAAKSLKDKLGYFFHKPGWEPQSNTEKA